MTKDEMNRFRKILERAQTMYGLPVTGPLEKALQSGFNLGCAFWVAAGNDLPVDVEERYLASIYGEA